MSDNFEITNINTDLTKEDLVAIAVAKHEQRLLLRRAEIEKDLKSMNKQQKALLKSRDALVLAVVDARYSENSKKAQEHLRILGIASSFATSWTFTNQKAWSDQEVPEVEGKLIVKMDNNHYHSKANFEFVLQEDALALQTQIDKIDDEIESQTRNLVETRRDLGNIASKERQARAAFAVQILNRSSKGRKMLADIAASDSVPLLGMA